MIQFTPSDCYTADRILRVHDDLQSAVRHLRLLAFESRPESAEWQTACLVGEIEILIDEGDMIEAALFIPKAVRQMNAIYTERGHITG